MDLIEQLGGYERASRVALNYYGSKGKVRYPNMDIDYYGVGTDCAPVDLCLIEFTYDDLNLALLEHRRANNIFEVEDKVVSTLIGDDFWKNLVCTIDGFHKKMIITKSGGHIIHHYEFRHATDEEIAAGHRL